MRYTFYAKFPSPCGVWVVSHGGITIMTQFFAFPSPCGVWVVSTRCSGTTSPGTSFRPLAGCGLFPAGIRSSRCTRSRFPSPCGVWVVSQIRASSRLYYPFPSPCGVWVVSNDRCNKTVNKIVSVPLRGVGCFKLLDMLDFLVGVSVPLRGVGCFSWRWSDDGIHCRFPSPCGVWVVSL